MISTGLGTLNSRDSGLGTRDSRELAGCGASYFFTSTTSQNFNKATGDEVAGFSESRVPSPESRGLAA
jgi:hypothetical protein